MGENEINQVTEENDIGILIDVSSQSSVLK
jgi:hypothetical protein